LWLNIRLFIKSNSRKSTRDFQDHLTANNRARAFALITSDNPSAWPQN